MKDKARDTAGLIYKYLKKGLTSSEKQRLWEWITESEANQKYFESITSRAELEAILDQVEYPDKEAIWQKIATESEDATIPSLPYMMHTPSRFKWWKYVAAASILLLGVAGWFYFNHSNGAAKMEDVTARYKDDVPPPTGNRTVLTLADGRVLALDSVETGMLAQQGNTRISLQADGRLLYQLKGSATAADAYNNTSQKGNPQNGSGETAQLHGAKTTPLLYNTISTARGGSYHLQLPDGSQVWLNAASSLRFPAAFTGSERKVELTGEAYFEIKPQYVAGNKQQKIPFKVSIRTASGVDKSEVEVLGTKFNVNAYEDEQLIRTTLTEGSVKLNNGASHSLIKPGQQGLIRQNDNNKTASIKIQPTPNEEEVLAWKNGLFVFDNTSLETIMRNVARWYDVSVVYEEKVSGGLHGSIPRDVPLSSVLKILELADGVHFKISGKQITVTR